MSWIFKRSTSKQCRMFCRRLWFILNTNRSHSQQGANTRAMIQIDAAFDKRNFKSASGLVVWGQMGALLATKTVLNTNVPSPFAAKAYAGLQAIKLELSLDLLSVTIIEDSQTVIKKCQTMKSDKSVIEAIIRDIQSKKICFHEINFQFINRSENVYAHKLAEETLRERKRTWWERLQIFTIRIRSDDGDGTQTKTRFGKKEKNEIAGKGNIGKAIDRTDGTSDVKRR